MNQYMMDKSTKHLFVTPRILQEVRFCPEQDILTGSVVGLEMGIDTTPQTVEEKDFSSDDFNFTWD